MTTDSGLVAINPGYAGLGNRMRFTLSSWNIAQSLGRRFSFVWPGDPVFGAKINDLWHFDAEELLFAPDGPIVTNNRLDSSMITSNPVLLLCSDEPVYALGCEKTWEQSLRELAPTEEIKQRTESVLDQIGGPFVGVQIRTHASAHGKTIKASPVDWFRQRMTEMLVADPGVRFFVSCDEESVQDRILNEFPSAVSLSDKGFHNSARALQASVVDLYVLARSTHLLGPYWSSFIDLAWAISGQSQVLETSRETKVARSAGK